MRPFPIRHTCNPRVMTCRKGRNGNETNVAFISLPAWLLEYNHVVICASRSPHPWPRLEIKEQRYRKFGEMTLSIETDKVVLVVQ
jgi:hypothetical protein